jgi:hypothetical protein
MAEVQAAWAARRVTAPELARQRLEAARGALDIRTQQSKVGRGTLDLVLEMAAFAADAERDQATGPHQREAALAGYWLFAREAERLRLNQVAAGQVTPADVTEATCKRLTAQCTLARARRRDAPLAVPSSFIAVEAIWIDAYGSARLPSALLEAQQSDLQQLAQRRLEAARDCFDERNKQFETGRGTLDLLLETARLLLDAELALAENHSARVLAHARYWLHTRVIDRLTTRRFEANQMTPADVLQARATRLKAEYDLARARAAQPGQPWPTMPLPDLDNQPSTLPFDWPRWLDELHAIEHSDPRQIARKWLEAARGCFEIRRKQNEAGRGTLDLLLEAGQMFLDAELLLAETDTARAAAWGRNLEHLQEVERLLVMRFEAGQVTPADVLQGRARRLEAQIQVARLRSGQLKQE